MEETIQVGKFKGRHDFLAEEVLIPNVDKTDASRVNMFTSHIRQAVVLKEGEFPRVFTGFENQVGKYSSSYRKAHTDLTVISRIIKNDLNSLVVIQDSNGFYDIVWQKPCERITENFGYAIHNDSLEGKKKGDVIPEGSVLYRSTAYDKDLNFSFGVNLRTVYLPFKNLTFEDAIVLSESAAKKLRTTMVEEITINVNNNDILINLYGTAKRYKSFPDIGEAIKERKLVARRRINYNSAFYDLSVSNLMKINYTGDTVFYSDGIVADIDVYSNAPLEKLENYPYNQQIVRYLKGNMAFYKKVYEVLDRIVSSWDGEGERPYSDDLAYMYKRAKDICDPEVRWRNQRNDFDNLIIRFTIMKEQDVVVGSKLVNRYGGKGVVSVILPDEEMPTTEDGVPAEIVLNPLGVINRLNPSQLYEQEINFISEYVRRKIDETEYLEDAEEILFDYVRTINPRQADALESYYNSLDDDGKQDFFADISEKGIYIHQPPFWDNINFEKLKALYEKYPDCKPYKFKGIEKPLIMGDMYFMRLRHEPQGKMSARSASYMSLKNIPSKSMRYRENQQLYSRTPIRIGEMELANLLIGNDIDEVFRLMSLYSITEADRQHLIKALLTRNIFDLQRVELTGEEPRTRQILDVYLKNMGLKLVRE